MSNTVSKFTLCRALRAYTWAKKARLRCYSFRIGIDHSNHPAQNLYVLPPGGKDRDKSSDLLACVCRSLRHLAASHRTKFGKIRLGATKTIKKVEAGKWPPYLSTNMPEHRKPSHKEKKT